MTMEKKSKRQRVCNNGMLWMLPKHSVSLPSLVLLCVCSAADGVKSQDVKVTLLSLLLLSSAARPHLQRARGWPVHFLLASRCTYSRNLQLRSLLFPHCSHAVQGLCTRRIAADRAWESRCHRTVVIRAMPPLVRFSSKNTTLNVSHPSSPCYCFTTFFKPHSRF